MEIIFILAVLVASVTSIVLIVSVLRRPAAGANSLIAFSVALAIAGFGSVFFWSDLLEKRLALGLAWFGFAIAATCLFMFSIEYTRRKQWLKIGNVLMLLAPPIISFFVILNGQFDWLFRHHINGLISGELIFDGPWAGASGFYVNIILMVTGMLLVRTYHGTLPFRRWSGWLVLATMAPIPATLGGFINLPLDWYLFWMLSMYSLSGILFFMVFIYKELLYIVPIPRELVVEKMADGWLVVDMENRILDLNPVAEDIVGSRVTAFGKDISTIISDWDSMASEMGSNFLLQINGRTGDSAEQQFLDLHALLITDRYGTSLGRLVAWHDVTEKKIADESRSRARDQMFSLLYSISSAASRTKTVDEFIHASTQQITHAFHCQASIVFLVNEMADNDAEDGLLMVASYGLPFHTENRMHMISYADPLIAPVLETLEPLFIEDMYTDARLPLGMRNSAQGGLLLVPMQTDRRLVGVLGLVRPPKAEFRADEIENIRSSADQMASFINADRRKQIAIALSERQKLVRDLHDSVTQKLYGLVALTEAAEAGMEAGSPDMLVKVLPRITENARQALKEMRLFLYELQPVDLEREGLVAVLHQRLASVEGRADIQARLVADENISLNAEKELALYYIAQEALNNVLKHAKAKNVTVRLHQGRMNVFMEIEDDGVGFDSALERTGSMGLRNMKYRVTQVGGRLKITSAPGKGSLITITVGRDPSTRVA